MTSPTFDTTRYARHLSLPGMGREGQALLKDSSVLIVGLGGLGCPSALYLAAAGIGRLGLAEFDRIETSNLQRQVLYTEGDVGKRKIDCAASALQARNRDLTLDLIPEGLTPENAVDVIRGYDLVLDGTDNFATRYLINDAAFFAKVPVISASLFQFECQVAVFAPSAGGPCYRCLFPDMPAPGEVPNCAEAGVFGALCGMVGSMQAMEAIKWITGTGEPLLSHLLTVDTLQQRHHRLRVDPDPACALCGSRPSITGIRPEIYRFACDPVDGNAPEIQPKEVTALTNALFVDVREPWEWELVRIPGALHLPLGEVSRRKDELPRDRPLVVYCHGGIRSLRAVEHLRAAGFSRAVSLQGGIDRWSVERDPTLPRY